MRGIALAGAVGLAAVGIASPGSAKPDLAEPAAGRGPLMELVGRFCVAGDADQAKVVALAKADGWKIADVDRNDPKMVDATKAFDNYEMLQSPDADDVGRMLIVGDMHDNSEPPMRMKLCEIVSASTSENGGAEIRERLGMAPTMDLGSAMSMWFYTLDATGQAVGFEMTDSKGIRAATEDGRLRFMMTANTDGVQLIAYGVSIPNAKP